VVVGRETTHDRNTPQPAGIEFDRHEESVALGFDPWLMSDAARVFRSRHADKHITPLVAASRPGVATDPRHYDSQRALSP
jgi:hypothetical protein